MYAELHAHSNFSFLDGASSTRSLVERAVSLGMGALAITDHDGLYNACIFSKAAREAGIRPIIGAELTLEGDHHLTLLIENTRGYANLSQLITRAHLAGSKGRPVLSEAELTGRTEGLICLSGCAKGKVSRLLMKGEKRAAHDAAKGYAALFGKDNFYVEIEGHLLPEDRHLCLQLVDLADALGLETVATNNVHYATRAEHILHDVLTCIRHRVPLDRSAPFRRLNSEFYLKGQEEMMRLPWLPRDAIMRAGEVAGRCLFDLDFSSFSYPSFPLPKGETATGLLRRLTTEKARARYGSLTEEILARIDDEITLIEEKGLSGYFLVVRDIVEHARKMGISAQGRGSAASSVVAYVLGITPVDPMRHKLFVGRFLNELSIPDIDVDIATNRREEVIQYVYDTYGRDHAAMVCTYVTFKGRGAIREVGKVLGLPGHVLDRMAKTLSAYGGRGAIDSLKEVPEFASYLDSGAWEHFGDLCTRIADFPRHLSIHVGGMILTPRPIYEIVPQEHARAEGRIVCQWDKDSVDDAGLIKFDLLGLRMLSLIDDAKELVRKHRGLVLNFDDIPPDDPEVFKMIGDADTVGVFQVESRAQMQTLPKVRPRSFEDLTMEVAIVRPGPLQGNMVHPFIRRRQGKEPVVHLHPKLAPILDETLGVILFQEQILQVAMAIAGFTAGEANMLRKAMGRKNAREELAKWHDRFVKGAREQGIAPGLAAKIFDHISGFADFGFCKSHAASFAILCYRSAYLKRYYPAEFYCALLNNQPMGFYAPEVITGDAKRHNVPVLPVDINRSTWSCSIEEGSLRIGFRYVKGIGEDKGDRILKARRDSLFTSLKDFADRVRLDDRSVQNLVAVGAFSTIRRSRRQLLWEAGTLRATTGFPELTPLAGDKRQESFPIPEMNAAEETITDYTFQGFSVSRHIMKLYRKTLGRLGAVTSGGLADRPSGTAVLTAGYMVCLQMPPTAKGGFSFMTLEDEEGLINVVIRPEVYRMHRTIIRLEPFLLVEGTVEKKDGLINVRAKGFVSLRQKNGQKDLTLPRR
ncbi:MAG: Error-prone DNA polymerase [Syntrophorhabdus sp. PtaB.Bin047]|nr:MAG: Error-prone DNA polymerase [Syntrophorhabdus sp. PtaB.Bin047]